MRKWFLLICIVFALFIGPTVSVLPMHSKVFAATSYVDGDFPSAMDAAKSALQDMNAVGHVASVLTTMMSDWIRRIAGPIPGITTNSTDQAYLQQMRRESFAYGANSVVTYVFTNPPASTYAFVRDTGESLGFFPKSAYAQGIGFSGLSALLPLWKAFRNIAYLLLAVFMIVIGFFIMLRKKIDPKTVVSVQNALPNIIVTLLLITFSYAIVGVLIDFMYLLIMISISILKPISNGVITNETMGTFISGSFWQPFTMLFSGGLYGVLTGFLGFFNVTMPQAGSTTSLGTDTMGLLGSLISGESLSGAVAFIPSLLLILLYIFAFLFAAIRLLIMLIKAHIQIIMALLISPFQLLFGAFPGSHAFEGWIKNLIANIAVFPITAIMLLIGSIIVKYSSQGTTKLWGPPMLNPSGSNGMLGIIGLGVLFAIPSVVGSMKEAMKTKSPVGMGIGGAVGFATSAGQQLMQYGMQRRYYEQSLRQAGESSKAQERAMKAMADAASNLKIK